MAVKGTNLRVFSPEVWSSFVKVYFKNRLYAAKLFMDFSDETKGGGDTITIPHLDEGPSPSTLTQTTGALTDFVVTHTRSQLTIDTWKGQSKFFSDFELGRIATKYNIQEMELRDNIAYKLSQDLDTALVGQNGEAANIQLHTGTSATAVNNTTVQEAIRIAQSYSLDFSGLVFLFHPNALWGELLRKQQFIDASQFGKPVISVPKGSMDSGELPPIGSLYGVPVYSSPQVGACQGVGTDGYPSSSHRNLLIHKRAIVYAIGNIDGMGTGPRLQTVRATAGGYLGTRVIGDLMYGTKTIGKYEGVRIISDT